MRLEAIVKWAKARGVNVERQDARHIDVWKQGEDHTIAECHNLREVMEAVESFVTGIERS